VRQQYTKIGLIIWLFVSQPFSFSASAESTTPTIPLAIDLKADAQQQLNDKKVILLYVSAPHCAFCKKLEKEILSPLLISGEYNNRITLRKIDWSSSEELLDFDGNRIAAKALLKQYAIQITPTLLFLNGKGEEINERLLGYRGGEFYWYYFDVAIESSNRVLNNQ